MTVDDVRDAVARVLSDIGADVRIEVDRGEDGLTQLVLPDGSLRATLLEPGTAAELLVAIADLVQNDVSLWLPGAWGRALPPCPGDPHPMTARVVDGEAWWVCPVTGAGVSRVGLLGA